MGSPDWTVSMIDIYLRKLLWVYCPGHAGVKENDRADRVAGKATLTSGLLLERSEVCVQELETLPAGTKPKTSHHRLPGGERRWKRKRRTIFLKGRERAIVKQTNIGTVSKTTLGKLLRDGMERIRAFPSTKIPYWTEPNWRIALYKSDKQQPTLAKQIKRWMPVTLGCRLTHINCPLHFVSLETVSWSTMRKKCYWDRLKKDSAYHTNDSKMKKSEVWLSFPPILLLVLSNSFTYLLVTRSADLIKQQSHALCWEHDLYGHTECSKGLKSLLSEWLAFFCLLHLSNFSKWAELSG